MLPAAPPAMLVALVAAIVPVPLVVIEAPEPTTAAMVVLVPLEMDGKLVPPDPLNEHVVVVQETPAPLKVNAPEVPLMVDTPVPVGQLEVVAPPFASVQSNADVPLIVPDDSKLVSVPCTPATFEPKEKAPALVLHGMSTFALPKFGMFETVCPVMAERLERTP